MKIVQIAATEAYLFVISESGLAFYFDWPSHKWVQLPPLKSNIIELPKCSH
jgi:hypothetical protein